MNRSPSPRATPGKTPATTQYMQANQIYSVAALTDSTGNVVERYTYAPYGKVKILAGDGVTVRTASAIGNPWTFTGRRLDGETGLMYYRARMFDTGLGRFVGRDPLRYVDGMSLYQYVRSSPQKYLDPLGWALLGCQFSGLTKSTGGGGPGGRRPRVPVNLNFGQKSPRCEYFCECINPYDSFTVVRGPFKKKTRRELVTFCQDPLVMASVLAEGALRCSDDCEPEQPKVPKIDVGVAVGVEERVRIPRVNVEPGNNPGYGVDVVPPGIDIPLEDQGLRPVYVFEIGLGLSSVIRGAVTAAGGAISNGASTGGNVIRGGFGAASDAAAAAAVWMAVQLGLGPNMPGDD